MIGSWGSIDCVDGGEYYASGVGAETDGGEDDVEADLPSRAAEVVDKDEGRSWTEIGSKDGVDGELKFRVGMAEDAEMRDEMAAWLCSLEVTFEVLSTADSGVTTGPLCNNG